MKYQTSDLLSEEQNEALQAICDKFAQDQNFVTLAGYAGTGKAQPINTIIPTPKGDMALKDLKVGSFVYDRQGNPTKVLNIFPQGKLTNYEITFADGRKTWCNEEHLFDVYTSDSEEETVTLTLKEMINRGILNEDNTPNFAIPVCQHIQHYEKFYQVDPYVVGVTAASGSKGVEILSKRTGLRYREGGFPETYLLGSIKQRMRLLIGILDIKGKITSYQRYSFTLEITDKRLVFLQLVAKLIYSLGFKGSITKGLFTHKLTIEISNEYKGYVFETRKYTEEFQLIKKEYNRKEYYRNAIVEVTKLPTKEEMLCIYVDNKEHLYLTNDYIVTHNTTLIKTFVDMYNLYDNARFVTFTGKAALVLRQKGLPATTIHQLIYNCHKNKRTGKYVFYKKKTLDPEIDLIIIDEISMVSLGLLRDIVSFGIPILAVGDPAQLAPVGGLPHTLLQEPDFFLKQIHRQAENNPILKLSMDIREGKPLSYMDNDKVKIIKKADLTIGMLHWADQILCATNRTRQDINNLIRKDLGYDTVLPCVGDKVICTKNYWDTLNENYSPLINGMLGTVIKTKAGTDFDLFGQECVIDFKPEINDGDYPLLKVDTNIFKNLAPTKITGNKKTLYSFDYGYAITVHKSQGSSWKNVLLFEEGFPQDPEEHLKWLYTGVTRAEDKLIIVR